MPLHQPISLIRPSHHLRPPNLLLLRHRHPKHLPRHQAFRLSSRSRNTTSPSSDPTTVEPTDPLTYDRRVIEERAYYTRRSYYAGAGAAICVAATLLIILTYDLPSKPEQNDAPGSSPLSLLDSGTAVVKGGAEAVRRKADTSTSSTIGATEEEEEEIEQIPTGTTTIPTFPKTLTLPSSSTSTSTPETFHLLGLGIRTVSFLSIQVYVVGLYISTSSIPSLQAALVRKVTASSTASTLVPDEKETLRQWLLDPQKSEEVWDEVLREVGPGGGVRSVLRIVPTRNTDFAHLRDGWVRGITGRSQAREREREAGKREGEIYADEAFGEAVGVFKSVFGGAGRKGVDKGKVLLLERDAKGVLGAWVEEAGKKSQVGESKKENGWIRMGEVRDERISRLVWLGYLAGKNVASEAARKSVVEGVVELVERPVGTVEAQVV